jgi:hypothetical protein
MKNTSPTKKRSMWGMKFRKSPEKESKDGTDIDSKPHGVLSHIRTTDIHKTSENLAHQIEALEVSEKALSSVSNAEVRLRPPNPNQALKDKSRSSGHRFSFLYDSDPAPSPVLGENKRKLNSLLNVTPFTSWFKGASTGNPEAVNNPVHHLTSANFTQEEAAGTIPKDCVADSDAELSSVESFEGSEDNDPETNPDSLTVATIKAVFDLPPKEKFVDGIL